MGLDQPVWSYKVIHSLWLPLPGPGYVWEGPRYLPRVAFINTGPGAGHQKSQSTWAIITTLKIMNISINSQSFLMTHPSLLHFLTLSSVPRLIYFQSHKLTCNLYKWNHIVHTRFVWFLIHNIIWDRFTHNFVCINYVLPFITELYFLVCIYHTLVICLLMRI